MLSIKSIDELNKRLGDQSKFFVLIHKSSSDVSQCAFDRLNKAIETTKGEFEVGEVDVTLVSGIHQKYKVETAPTLLVFEDGELNNVIKGCMDEDYYKALLADELNFRGTVANTDKKIKHVVVYTTPTCSWCTKIKEHLKANQIAFREVDVASNPSKADEMRKKSGQMGVPQTEINGQMIVGFDRPKIDRLLEIG